MKEDFKNILNMKTKLNRVLLFLVCLIISIAMLACNSQNSNKDNDDAVEVVTKHLESQRDKDYDTWRTTIGVPEATEVEFGVISLIIDKIDVSAKRTNRLKEHYIGSESAKKQGWSDDYINENMIAVHASYTVEYDNEKVPLAGGEISQYFYLRRKNKDSPWFISDSDFSP